MWRPDTLAEAVRRIENGEDEATAIAEFLDTFYFALQRTGKVAAQACIDDEPARVADPILQAYLGAIGEHLALRWCLTAPRWTNQPDRFLRRPYFTAVGLEGLKAMSLAQSPTAFRRRMIFTEAEPLRRARLPRDDRGRPLESWQIGIGGLAQTVRTRRQIAPPTPR